jgi:hypothetical protein
VDSLRREVEGELERRLLEVESLIRERQHALEELERSRRRFLKGMRTLLEREIDAVQVEESRPPLDDTPLDLDLRGWRPEADQRPAAESDEAGPGEEDELPPAAGAHREGAGDAAPPPPRGERPPWLSSILREKGLGWTGDKE